MGGEVEPLMTLQDLADYLDVPVTTLYQWRHRGEGPRAFKLGRQVRYRREDIDRWLDERAEQPEPAA